jgi:ribosomal-protein-alanine N-acetyltransferase
MHPIPLVRLVPATVALLEALRVDPARFAELIGSLVPDGWPQFPEAVDFTLMHLRDAPEADRPWSMQLFVDGVTGRLVGSGHTLPGPNPSTGVLVSLGFEHVADQEDPDVGAVWEWSWTQPLGR